MTAQADIRDTLAGHPFAAGLAPRLVDALAGMARIAEHPVGTWITVQGGPADEFHLVVDGRCAIEVAAAGRDPLVIATVHAGEVLGWSWMLAPHVWHFDVLALDHTRSIAVDGALLREACDTDHELGYEIVRRLAQVIASRLEATRLQLVDMYGQHR